MRSQISDASIARDPDQNRKFDLIIRICTHGPSQIRFPEAWKSIIVSEAVLGVPVQTNAEEEAGGDLWISVANHETGEIVRFDRRGAEILASSNITESNGGGEASN